MLNTKSKIRKYLPLIVSAVGFIAIPFFVFADIHGPNECCVLDHNLTDIDGACTNGAVISAKGCDTIPANSTCIQAGPPLDDCKTDKSSPLNAVYTDPEDISCDNCWCDVDDDGKNNANCAGDQNPDMAGVQPIASSKDWGTCCIVDTIYNVTDWVYYVLLIGVSLAIITAGFFFLTAGGDPNKIKSAQSSLIYGMIALALAIMSKVIPAIIKAVVS